MVAYAPDSSKSMGMYEAVISSVLGVLREGRRGAARDFHISGDVECGRSLSSAASRDTAPAVKTVHKYRSVVDRRETHLDDATWVKRLFTHLLYIQEPASEHLTGEPKRGRPA